MDARIFRRLQCSKIQNVVWNGRGGQCWLGRGGTARGRLTSSVPPLIPDLLSVNFRGCEEEEKGELT